MFHNYILCYIIILYNIIPTYNMLQAAAAEGSKNKKKGKKKLSATGVSNGGIIESAGPSTAAGSITHGDEVTYFFLITIS